MRRTACQEGPDDVDDFNDFDDVDDVDLGVK